MATYTSNYAWAKPSGSDPVDISVLNGNLDSQDGIMHDAFLNMADPFSESSTYAVGNIVVYGTKTYKCHTAVTTAGSWTGATNWDEYKLSEGGLVAGDYVKITNGIINVQTEIGTYDYVRYEMESTGGGAIKLIVRKYVNNVLDSTTEYPNDGQHHEIDDVMDTWYEYGPYLWHYKLLVASTDHAVGYEESWSYQDTSVHTVNFQFAQDDSTTLVTKGDLDDADGDIYAVMGQMGAKNLIPYPYYKSDNTEQPTTGTDKGITWTINDDKSVTITGKATADFSFYLAVRGSLLSRIPLKAGSYKLTGCPSGGSNETYSIYLNGYKAGTTTAITGMLDTGDGIERTYNFDMVVGVYIIVKSGTRIQDPLTFKPMLRLASDTDDTYQPYAKTNKQLTDEIATKADVSTVAEKAEKTATATGEALALAPTSEGKALIHTAYGMSVQDGTPTPSVPVDIVSAKADFRSVGKNLIPYPYYETTKTQDDVTFTDNSNGTVTVVTTGGGATKNSRFYFTQIADNFCFEKGKTYILTDGVADGGSSNYKTEVALYNGLTYAGTVFGTTNGSVEFTLPNNDSYDRVTMYIAVYKNQVITSPITFKPMLRLADVTDSAFEPYTKHDTTTDLTLRAIEVTSTDDYNLVRDGKYYIADTLDYDEDNGWSVTRRIGEYEVLGTEGWNYVGDAGSKRVYIAQSSLGISAKSGATEQGYSSHFVYNGKTVSSITWGNYYFSGSNLVISANNSDITDITTAESWLSSNKPNFDYILVTPTTEPITTAQALALLGLKTYDESTTISSQAEPSCTVAIEYAKERLGALALTAYNTAKGNDLRITALEG